MNPFHALMSFIAFLFDDGERKAQRHTFTVYGGWRYELTLDGGELMQYQPRQTAWIYLNEPVKLDGRTVVVRKARAVG